MQIIQKMKSKISDGLLFLKLKTSVGLVLGLKKSYNEKLKDVQEKIAALRVKEKVYKIKIGEVDKFIGLLKSELEAE